MGGDGRANGTTGAKLPGMKSPEAKGGSVGGGGGGPGGGGTVVLQVGRSSLTL